MPKRNESPEKTARRAKIREFLKDNPLKDGNDINALMRDLMAEIIEGSMDAELEEELGYSRYDYKNKETENSRNGFTPKTLHTSYGDLPIDVPRDRAGDFEPQLVKKHQKNLTQDIEDKIISMYATRISIGSFN